jgi:chromosome partitioning protein
MSQRLAVVNQKGGVGKTTTTVNIAACLAEAGCRVALIDLDPQRNATLSLGVDADGGPGCYEWLAGRAPLAGCVRATAVERLMVVPASADLAGLGLEVAGRSGWQHWLAESLTESSSAADFDYVAIDCPPSLGPLTVMALVAADRLVVPVQSEFLALDGLASLLETVERVKLELNPSLEFAGLVLTMHDPELRLAREVEIDVRRHFEDLVFETVIPRSESLAEAPSHGRSAIHHDASAAGSEAYFDLCKELAERV